MAENKVIIEKGLISGKPLVKPGGVHPGTTQQPPKPQGGKGSGTPPVK